jgi:hypothetical protein
MKTTFSLCLAALALAPAQAQIFRPEAVNGAVIGGLIGGVIGHQSGGHNGWQGAALGAAAGLLIGQAVGEARDDRFEVPHRGPAVYRSSPSLDVRIGYGHGYGHRAYGVHGVYRHPGLFGSHGWHRDRHPYYYRSAPLRSVWSGPAYRQPWTLPTGYPTYGYSGYGDYPYLPAETPAVTVVPAAPAPAPAPAPAAPTSVTIINHYYQAASPMTSANALFGR